MDEGSGEATALLGMDGFVVLSMTEEDGEWWLLVEAKAASVGCPSCGVRAVGHGRSVVQVRDLPVSGKPVRLLWRKRRWRCTDTDCPRRTFSEHSPFVEGSLTRRARAEICRRVGEDGHSVASVARAFGVGWAAAMSAVADHGRPLVEDPGRAGVVRALGVDEHKMLAAGPRHRAIFATQLVDLDTGRLLDVVPSRSGRAVSSWLDLRGQEFKDQVKVAAIDPHAGYQRALRTTLPEATVTVDPFHLIKLANACIDDVRRRVQQETLGHRGRRDDPLYGVRRLLTRGWERLSERQEQRLVTALHYGDPFDEVGVALVAKEELRQMYTASNPRSARRHLASFYGLARRAGVKEVSRLARTVKRWEAQILSFFVTGKTNARSEAANLVTEKLRRIAHGMRNFDNYRLRLLLHSGVEWNTPSTARIRGRRPRLIA
jgi:transposase